MTEVSGDPTAQAKPLGEQLQEVHDLLEEQATDVANAAKLYYVKTLGVQKVIKALSTLAGSISVVLLNAKTGEGNGLGIIDEQEHELMTDFAAKLGNAQFEMQGLIEDVNQFNDLANKISSRGSSIANSITEIQSDFDRVESKVSSLSSAGVNTEQPTQSNAEKSAD